MVLCLHIPPKLFFWIVYTVLDSLVESLWMIAIQGPRLTITKATRKLKSGFGK